MSDLLDSCRKNALAARLEAERTVEIAIVWEGLAEQIAQIESRKRERDALSRAPLGEHDCDASTDGINIELRTAHDRVISMSDHLAVPSEVADYATGTMSEQTAKPGRVDLVAASTEAASIIASSGTVKGVSVDLIASSQLAARGDKPAIVQIISNILSNAVRYSPRGEPVVINISQKSGRALLTVADRGPGIATDNRNRIFERRQPGGLGHARHLARQMGGNILLDSAPGQGASFTLDLQIA